MSLERIPYWPVKAEWRETLDMLCTHCAHAWGCDVLEGMIEMKEGKPWPEGGWVTDPGAGVTCLSYQPQPRERLSRQRLRQEMRGAVPMCGGCAAQKGSEASVSLHTRRDFAAAVKNRHVFACHEGDNHGKPCGGWCQAVRRQMKGAKA
jgi:hypothetical protein